MYLCEDMEMEPIMAVWAGLSHLTETEICSETAAAGYSLDGESLPEDELAPYIQIAIDQINFVIGDPATNEYGMSSPFRYITRLICIQSCSSRLPWSP